MTKIAYKVVNDVRPSEIDSAYVDAPFDKGKEALGKAGYKVISLRDNARLRMQEGADSPVSRTWNWTREGVLYVPEKGTFLTKNNPIMQNPADATNAHRRGEDFYLANEQVEYALEDSVSLEGGAVLTGGFSQDSRTAFAFGDVAQAYGDFLGENDISEMPILLGSIRDKPFVRPMWFGSLVNGSGLGGGRDLDFGNRVRGVRSEAVIDAEGVASERVGAYTTEDIKKALRVAKLSGVEQILLNHLNR